MAEQRLSGRAASPGFAEGALYYLPDLSGAERQSSGHPEAEAAALHAAISSALETLQALAASTADEAADMIGFQIAMLEDDALSETAFEAIRQGAAADLAWRSAMDAEINSYRAADDEYFRARSADLEDIRDTVLNALIGGNTTSKLPDGAILAGRDLPPSQFLSVDWTKGGAIVLSEGSPTSHVAMLARARGVPMIVGVGTLPQSVDGSILIDGAHGIAIINPTASSRSEFIERRVMDDVAQQHATSMATKSAVTKSGDPVTVLINVADPTELTTIDPALCDGIGLVRTEFLFSDRHGLPNEDTQYRVYRQLVEWAKGRPVTIRTLDAGGDKPIRGLTIDGESNPFLGVRGVRLSLTRPDIFRIQLRALLRASALGALKVMVPMITVPEELATVRTMMQEELAALQAASIDAAMPPLGMMVEVPAAALAIDCFDAEFYSIGSNDLTQYVTAAGRDIGAVADLADMRHPGVLRLIEQVVAYGQANDREVSLCGDAAGEATLIPALLDTGLRTFSVAPGLVGRTKLAMSAHTPASPRGAQ